MQEVWGSAQSWEDTSASPHFYFAKRSYWLNTGTSMGLRTQARRDAWNADSSHPLPGFLERINTFEIRFMERFEGVSVVAHSHSWRFVSTWIHLPVQVLLWVAPGRSENQISVRIQGQTNPVPPGRCENQISVRTQGQTNHRIMLPAQLEGTHKDLQVQTLVLQRTIPKIVPSAWNWISFGRVKELGNRVCHDCLRLPKAIKRRLFHLPWIKPEAPS